jgi:CubicO group peptidase (beta-lactamase class C family)
MTRLRSPTIPLIAGLALLSKLAGADAVDDFVNAHRERHRIPGISIALVRDGQLVKAAGYGLANVELDAPARPETVYQSGSLGKQFTAMAVMLLVEEGKIRLDDPLTKYFPEAPGRWKKISVRHLLTHTSGIKDFDYGKQPDLRRDYSEDQLARIAMKLPPDFPPGTQWSYSNTGYVLLGIIVSKTSGKFYGDFLKQRVFSPLGMDATRIITEKDIVKNRAAGYVLEKDQLTNQGWVSPSLNTTADGSLYFSVLDLARWDAALRAGKLLKPESYAAMWSPVHLADGTSYPYGFGWGFDEQRGEKVIEHGGSWQGFRTAIARYVDTKLTVIVLANLAQAEPERLAADIAGIVEPSLALPELRKGAADPDPATTAAMRGVLEAWGNGSVSPRMAKGLRGTHAGTAREKRQRERTAKLLAKAKGFWYLAADDVAGKGIERRGEAVSRILYYGLEAEDADVRLRFFLNAQGEVADFAAARVD